MMVASPIDVAQRLASLFRETGTAHHREFIASGGDDPEWPLWYAEYLLPKMESLVPRRLTRSEIVYLLVRAERDRRALSPGLGWPEYYSGFFLGGGDPALRS